MAAFDASSNLLATRLDDSPCAVWIWDVASAELRAVLLFHSNVTFTWHPSVRELLLLTSQDETSRQIFYVWDPLSNGPRCLSLENGSSPGKIEAKARALWVNWANESPCLLLSEANHFTLASLADSPSPPEGWPARGIEERLQNSAQDRDMPFLEEGNDDDQSTLEDTFSFKHG